jgi:hypothetical protein
LGDFWKPYIRQVVGGYRNFEDHDWRSGKAGYYPIDEHVVEEEKVIKFVKGACGEKNR